MILLVVVILEIYYLIIKLSNIFLSQFPQVKTNVLLCRCLGFCVHIIWHKAQGLEHWGGGELYIYVYVGPYEIHFIFFKIHFFSV